MILLLRYSPSLPGPGYDRHFLFAVFTVEPKHTAASRNLYRKSVFERSAADRKRVPVLLLRIGKMVYSILFHKWVYCERIFFRLRVANLEKNIHKKSTVFCGCGWCAHYSTHKTYSTRQIRWQKSTEDPIPGILRFSQAVSLQPLYFTKLFTEENGTIPQYPPLKSLADSPDGMHPHKQKQPMQEYPLRVQYRQE